MTAGGNTSIRHLKVLGRFRKISKKDSFVMSVHLSVRVQQLHSHWTDFHEIFFELLSKIC
jgi:hypothetical protein